ncbi:MAG: DUF5916 domain-containing protein, partial [Rhodothermales bacterium]|nr:DUF5916 domain-containing protein [Rhodothermales bacterium]
MPRLPLYLALVVLSLLLVPPAISTAQQRTRPDAQSALAENSEGVTRSASGRLQVSAVRLTESTIAIDGRLDEAAWQGAPVIEGFRQREPVEGAPATERTVVRVLYDDEALYIGARMFDAAPDSIVARLGRRDANLDADAFGFFIDPYLDRRTGFYFAVNASGTLMDGVLMNDDWDDDSWDGVWQARTRMDDEGWVAEMRIPYSQLRFRKKDVYTWGINFRRDIARKNEQTFLVFTPRGESGFVSRFADLIGVEAISPPRQLEATPYVTTRAAFTDAAEGDPFNDGSDFQPDLGVDFKVGLTSNLTLNGTVNPDFGQVEVDPAVVNLSDRETFFPEKRPFFIEGSSIFNFGMGGSNNFWGFNFGNPDFFYSRRVGRAPSGGLPSHDYADMPESARILGALKLTGKVGGGWNIGAVQAMTDDAVAAYELDGVRGKAEVEPRSYYGIVRGQREISEGRHALGFISTTTVRDFGDGNRLEDQINGSAYVAGIDGWTTLDEDRTWVLTGWAGLSNVNGTKDRITSLQRSSLHYFQRPDADHVDLDSSATSLTGMGGRLMLNKQRGRFYTNAAVGFFSPSFDLNDAGFLWRSDLINGHLVLGYRWYEPKSFYRRIFINTSHFQSFDFGGNRTEMGFWGNTFVQFKNFYGAYVGGRFAPTTLNNTSTRGGPLMESPQSWVVFGGGDSDSRKALIFGLEGWRWQNVEGSNENSLQFRVEWRPMPSLNLSVAPNLTRFENVAQYVTRIEDPAAGATFGNRYVFGHLEQTTVAANIRLNWTFTPMLSLQLFAQPLISAGDYTELKELARARSYDFNVYGRDNGSTFDEETYEVDPDGAGPA